MVIVVLDVAGNPAFAIDDLERAMKIPCPACGDSIRYTTDSADTHVRCPYCQSSLYLPPPDRLPQALRDQWQREVERSTRKEEARTRRAALRGELADSLHRSGRGAGAKLGAAGRAGLEALRHPAVSISLAIGWACLLLVLGVNDLSDWSAGARLAFMVMLFAPLSVAFLHGVVYVARYGAVSSETELRRIRALWVRVLITFGRVVIMGAGVVALLWVAGSVLMTMREGSRPVRSAPIPLFNADVVTLSDYVQIDNGMSYSQVVAIIGDPGVEMARNRMDGVAGVMASLDTVMYVWQNPNGSNMNAMFQNDRLVQKAQFGLR